ncbi:plasmid partitioning protein RepB [Pseudochrobactrum sp. sp1633]|uniref:plasmid partitioning protein RepB n=1 Tax=Pseudochrobactrum sp. sp1633 TaxID=3036706 RepID=UPI0025A53DD1|nr:plasmid partitioning protein RepB [Pseudochrobactrum sp. sp1633]MDM8346398.1 plasmid partitioning protein RepB [Pseudochrobactrum sp. sp1633]HWD14235.1 plasmid partitioning protein RepB [Pseudochrobactrum sp.]
MNSSSRKNQLKALFGAPVVPTPEPKVAEQSAPLAPQAIPAENLTTPEKTADTPMRSQASRSGAVKAMGLSLADMSRELESAKQLSESLAKGDQVVELDAALIDGSFVEDRLTRQETDDPDFLALVQSLHQHGQQVPILVRPHPEKTGRYQAAYGHRRMRAAARLGLPVKALIKPLSDAELVLAQGKENSERRDLSFIERALFAQALIERGFDRTTVQDALSLHKAEMTRFLQVATAIPEQIIRAIGPAPKVGRPRWMQLADALRDKVLLKQAQRVIAEQDFKDAETDLRFQHLLQKLTATDKAETQKPAEHKLRTRDGESLGLLRLQQGRAQFDIQHHDAEAFAEYLAGEMAALFEKYRQVREK